jgi:glycosyltransferase involved in cell wall biosynthesis
MPLAMLEAMHYARPVVAVDVAGHSELIVEGASGFLARSATVDDFRSALERTWESKSRLREMGRTASKHLSDKVPTDPIQEFADQLQRLL